jgi:hypothetical protein
MVMKKDEKIIEKSTVNTVEINNLDQLNIANFSMVEKIHQTIYLFASKYRIYFSLVKILCLITLIVYNNQLIFSCNAIALTPEIMGVLFVSQLVISILAIIPNINSNKFLRFLNTVFNILLSGVIPLIVSVTYYNGEGLTNLNYFFKVIVSLLL